MENSPANMGGSSIYSEKEIQSKRNRNNFLKFSLILIILVIVALGIYFGTPYLAKVVRLYTFQDKLSPSPTPFPSVKDQMNFLVEKMPKDEQGIGVLKTGEKQFNISGVVNKIDQQTITLSIKGESATIGLDAKTLYSSRPKLMDIALSTQEKIALYKKISREEIATGQEVEVVAEFDDKDQLIAKMVNLLL